MQKQARFHTEAVPVFFLSNKMPNPENLKPFKKGEDSRRPIGRKPGAKNKPAQLFDLINENYPSVKIEFEFVKKFVKNRKSKNRPITIKDADLCTNEYFTYQILGY